MLKAKYQRNLRKILPFGIIWGVFGLLYVLLEYGIMGNATAYPSTNNPYKFSDTVVITTLAAFTMGILLGIAEVFFVNQLFAKRTFWQKLLFKTIVHLLGILILLLTTSLFINSSRLNKPLFDPVVTQSIIQFISNFVFWSIVIYAGAMTLISLFVSEVSDYLGNNVFNNFFTGKYHRPIEEERIFMFLDMRSSTTIAERLGHIEYFHLLNQYYADTTDAILQTSGEVYQYAGDEIIVSWNLKKGVENLNCIRCFFLIKDTFQAVSRRYIQKYGLVPEFKAGFHFGKVTTGEIGTLKKEIFFTGDVMNTTARIQALCNDFGTDILLSQALASKLGPNSSFDWVEKGERGLKGKHQKVRLYSVVRNVAG